MNYMVPHKSHAAPAPADLRRRIEKAVERLIAALDALDEPNTDLEPSLGATEAVNQEKAWRARGEPDLEFGGEGVEDENLEDGHDREDDPAESGIGDDDGRQEQLVGEPSLGATEDFDQRIAWSAGGGFYCDGEATGTFEDIKVHKSREAWEADRQASALACAHVREIVGRRRARARA